jgi:hypothetical protein
MNSVNAYWGCHIQVAGTVQKCMVLPSDIFQWKEASLKPRNEFAMVGFYS